MLFNEELKKWLEENALEFDYGEHYKGIADLNAVQLAVLKTLADEALKEKLMEDKQ